MVVGFLNPIQFEKKLSSFVVVSDFLPFLADHTFLQDEGLKGGRREA
jgi:hypothetical protein